MADVGAGAETLSGAQAAMLQAWLSPAVPIGAFAWSHGLEQAVEAGAVSAGGEADDRLQGDGGFAVAA